jgi:hypothetical protein
MRPALPLGFVLPFVGMTLGGETPEHLKATRTLDFSLTAGMGYTQHGYRVTGPENQWVGMSVGASITPNNGGPYISVLSTGAPVTIVQADGLNFDALSADIAEYSTVAIPNVVTFRGTKKDGAVLNFDFVPDRVIDGSGPMADFQTVSFPAGWTGLVKLEVITTRVALDNITLRSLALDDFNPKEAATASLELLGLLEGGPYDSWGVTDADGDRIDLWNQRYTYDPVSLSSFSVATGGIVRTVWISSGSGGNLETGETAWVQDGELIWNLGDDNRVLARVGSAGVTGISYPTPGHGQVLFANHWYQGQEKFAVFLAGPEGVTPVLLPGTILPDGGTPRSFPRELHYTGSSYAIATSTSNSDSLFVLSFAGGPLRLSPGHGDVLPGTNLIIDGRPVLRWLDDHSAGLVAKTQGLNGPEFDLEVLQDGSWTATQREGPVLYAQTVLPGLGLVQRHYSTVIGPAGSPLVTYGTIHCHDLGLHNGAGLVAWTGDDGRHLLIQEGAVLEGFGTVAQVFPKAHLANGIFHVTARNADGQVGLFRGRMPAAAPAVRAGSFVPTQDGTVRFMVENLTHGRSYVVESADTPTGPWTTASRFTAGSAARSVLGGFQYEARGFFRVVVAE